MYVVQGVCVRENGFGWASSLLGILDVEEEGVRPGPCGSDAHHPQARDRYELWPQHHRLGRVGIKSTRFPFTRDATWGMCSRIAPLLNT